MILVAEEKDLKERIQELMKYRKHGITKLDGRFIVVLAGHMLFHLLFSINAF
jgi:hypothetical protein